MKPIFRAVALLIFLLPQAESVGDEIGDALANAKTKYATALSTAKANLNKAIDAEVKKAAVDGKLDAVKTLLAAKEKFDADDTIPSLPELMPAVATYVEARRVAAGDLYRVYQQTVKHYTSKLLVAQASAVETEMKKFVETEKKGGAIAKPMGEVPVKTKSTKDLIDEFYTKYCEGMDKIEEQDTSVKREQVHQQMAKRLDDALKSQSWTLRCPVRDVQFNGRSFEIVLDAPEETPDFREKWDHRTSVSNIKLSKEQALDLKPGDTLILTGTPRFYVDEYKNDTVFFRRTLAVEVADRHSHSIHLINFKFATEKSKVEPTEDKADAPESPRVPGLGPDSAIKPGSIRRSGKTGGGKRDSVPDEVKGAFLKIIKEDILEFEREAAKRRAEAKANGELVFDGWLTSEIEKVSAAEPGKDMSFTMSEEEDSSIIRILDSPKGTIRFTVPLPKDGVGRSKNLPPDVERAIANIDRLNHREYIVLSGSDYEEGMVQLKSKKFPEIWVICEKGRISEIKVDGKKISSVSSSPASEK
ncbi:MAG: hypothetical protein ACKVP0_11135 [Pirellulaceae bacterium]